MRNCRAQRSAIEICRATRTGLMLVAIWLTATSDAQAQRPLGIDVSHWNGTINWTQVYNSGRVFAFAKATEGVGYTDDTFVYNATNARGAGVYVAPYHFARPEYGNTATAEANYFVQVAGAYMTAGYLRPALDLESGTSLSKDALSTWVNTFCNRVVTLTGIRPVVYTNWNFAANYLNSTVTQWDLWYANPTNGNPQTGNPATTNWSTWTFWQYSWTGTVPGISSDCDLNVFHGTLAEMISTAVIPGTPPDLYRSPATLTANATLGYNAASQAFIIENHGAGTLTYTIASDVAWATVNPNQGNCIAETDSIAVNYNVSTMTAGTYTGTITITGPGALHSPQTIALTLNVKAIPGDLDQDGDIDVMDVVLFDGCMSGPLVPQTDPTCSTVDFDKDSDVDGSDFGIMQKCLSGPAVAADPMCTN